MYFLIISFFGYKEYMIYLISDVLPAFTCPSAIGGLWSICLRVNILVPLPFRYSLKLRTFSTLSTIFIPITYSDSGLSFMLISSIDLMDSLIIVYLKELQNCNCKLFVCPPQK